MLDEGLTPGGDFLGRRGTVAIDVEVSDQELFGQDAATDGNGEVDMIGRDIDLEMLQELIGRMGGGRSVRTGYDEQEEQDVKKRPTANDGVHRSHIVRCMNETLQALRRCTSDVCSRTGTGDQSSLIATKTKRPSVTVPRWAGYR